MTATYTPFTACLITFNEEKNLRAALESVAFADEIVVVDSHSTDRTREIAAAFRGCDRLGRAVRPRVFERDWRGHVGQKNHAIELAAHEWVLCLDADERLSPELQAEIKRVLSTPRPPADGFTAPRLTWYLGRWIRRGGWYPDRKLRLFRRSCGRWGGTNPHDHVYVKGNVSDLSGDLYHYSYRDIEAHIRQIDYFTGIVAEEKDVRGVRRPVVRMLTHPPAKFLKMYVLKRAFREGVPGFVVSVLGAFYVFLKYAKLWERRQRGGGGPRRR